MSLFNEGRSDAMISTSASVCLQQRCRCRYSRANGAAECKKLARSGVLQAKGNQESDTCEAELEGEGVKRLALHNSPAMM